jgi:pimeloyl-ACP methyl ester carboxylesterase
MTVFRNLTAAVLLLLAAAPAAAQQPAGPPPVGQAEFVIFIGGKVVGREQVNLAQSAGNWIITSTGGISGPVQVINNRFEVKYAADWQPLELHLEGSVGGKPVSLNTSFGMTTAVSEITQTGFTTAKTDQVSARTIVLPTNFFAAYEALAARLAGAAIGTELPIYIAPQAEIKAMVKAMTVEKLSSPGATIEVRRYDLVFQNPGGPLAATVAIDARNRLVRIEIAAAGLSVVRADVAAVSVRPQTARNPTDVDVTIPASGFNLAGTLTTPPAVAPRLRHPAVILVAGSGPVDRDATVAGIPIFTQLAGSLAQQGFVVLRYDKRGVGQSGGRSERATIEDFAEDVLAAVRWLRRRKDVNNNRIAVAGHSEGGAVAMLAAARTDQIEALVLIAAPGTTGSDLILEQQRHLLARITPDEKEREAKIDLQRRIHTAVLTGIGWQGIPADLRQQADSPWFKSLLSFDPARVMTRVRQPVLVVQGDLDKQVFPHHADKLGDMARARKRKTDVEVVHLPGVNHLLVGAITGEVREYGDLEKKTLVPEFAQKIADWLRKN